MTLSFIHEDFLLQTETARTLYHQYAKPMPIYDYHCHLSPQDIADNRRFANVTELWLEGDHYKWRAMRAHGIDEHYITGAASPKEKFDAWAKTVPYTIGNALYHWTHLELKTYFGIDTLLSEETADAIWEACNAHLAEDDFTVRRLIERSNVRVICTTDDPTDDLRHHETIKQDTLFAVAVLPTFRPDKAFEVNKPTFVPFVETLERVTGTAIDSFEVLANTLIDRVTYFHEHGCRLADHGLAEIPYVESTEEEVATIFTQARDGLTVSRTAEHQFKTALLQRLAAAYSTRGWAMQLHFGAIRNTNTRRFEQLGPDAGFDSMSDQGEVAAPLNALLDSLDVTGHLPRTIIYNLNPVHNELIGTTIQNFQTEAGIAGKIQLGSGWWFNDTKPGMTRQLTALADQGLLAHFVGMLTDSRSFISYSRHEYFRRVLCNLIGQWVEDGEVPNDPTLLKRLVEDISYHNAAHYFSIEL